MSASAPTNLRLRDRLRGRLFRRGASSEAAPVEPTPPRIIAMIPAHNEADVIATCIQSLLDQTVVPDEIVVIADNCDDDTESIAASFGAPVVVMRTVDNEARKVGALAQGWTAYGHRGEFLLGVDADSRLDPTCVADLLAEAEANPAIGGVMARYSFDQSEANSTMASMLLRQQRQEFTAWTLDLLRKDRSTYVLGGQATLFRTSALTQVAVENRRPAPWTTTSQVEDMELTWRLRELGWETAVSATARAWVGPMVTVKSLWAQRRKWDTGIIRLLRREGFQEYTSQPWRLQAKMLLDTAIRVLFAVLLVVSLTRGSWVWYWVWLIPPALASILNVRIALRMPNRTATDVITAALLVPTEMYLAMRILTWTRSWFDVLFSVHRDGWSAQYRAEGKGARS